MVREKEGEANNFILNIARVSPPGATGTEDQEHS
jgi:hypothetical protein